MAKLYRKRKLVNRLSLTLTAISMLIGLSLLAWILSTLLIKGAAGFSITLFTQMTAPPGEQGGLRNAILGSLCIVATATIVSAPFGLMAGIYLAEYGKQNKLAGTVRFINDLLLSSPSIIIGLFVYSLYVVPSGHYSGVAGSMALGILAIPIVIRTTENMLRLVPNSLREAAAALGAPQWKVVFSISLYAARSGILTGILLAIARISGETAPLLFTALNSPFWTPNLNQPMANLPYVINQFAQSPFEDWQHLAWAGAALITVAVLALNIAARLLFSPLSTRP